MEFRHVSGLITVEGGFGPGLEALAGRLEAAAQEGGSAVYVRGADDPHGAMAGARLFAAGGAAGLVVFVLPEAGMSWDAARARAEIGAFVRWSAAAWAGQRMRVNAIEVEGALVDDVAGLILAMSRWLSMTGQMIRLSHGGIHA